MAEASESMERYFEEIQTKVEKAYAIAARARKKGYDPSTDIEIPLARNMAERVEGLISIVMPQIKEKGIPERIAELEKEYGKLDWRVAFTIALEVSQEKFCGFRSKREAMETGIRTGLAYITLGVVASPLEGFVGLKVKKRGDGKEYVCLMYSGPIRSAGGTGASVSVLVADYLRKAFGYDVYDPTEDECKRMVTEIYDYHERVTNLQYLPSQEEIMFLVRHLPVEISGDASEDLEVSNYKDLARIETNRVRNGPCLVLAECLAQKAQKVLTQLSKWGKELGMEEWLFLKEFVQLQKTIKSKTKQEASEKVSPNYTYIEDLVAGRPILTHPLQAGGFRLRYGRSRNSGYSSAAISPITMAVLKKYIAIGTQLKTERPGKAAALCSCDAIEGPIVKLENGSVLRLQSEQEAKKISSEIKEILYLGDILVSYGDFYNRAHPLVPAGYCEEWWVQELEKAIVDHFGTLDLDKASAFLGIERESLEMLLKSPLSLVLNAEAALKISDSLKVSLYPRYSYYWKTISKEELIRLVNWLEKAKLILDNPLQKIILPLEEKPKRVLELLGVPHAVVNKEYAVIEKDDAASFAASLGMPHKNSVMMKKIIEECNEGCNGEGCLSIVNKLSLVKIRDKAGTFVGARMGRPEKAKIRKLKGDPNVLFPVGEEGGKLRSFQAAIETGKVKAEFPLYRCDSCKIETVLSVCEKCDERTKRLFYCSICGLIETNLCQKHGTASRYMQKEIDIKHYLDQLLQKLKIKECPPLIKGVRGTSNREHIPENLMKGILRARYDVQVNKDGTTRYDMTQLAITHFKPKEIRTSVEKLKELGYTNDIYGSQLEHENQLLELKAQDIILPSCPESPDAGADRVLFRIASFIDEMLKRLYKVEAFYKAKDEGDLIGHMAIALAPHTSAGIVCRIIGFSQTQGFYAHPLLHAATRRDCLGYDNYVSIKKNGCWEVVKIGEFIEKLNPTEKADNFGTLKKGTVNVYTSSNPGQGKVVEVTKHEPRNIFRISLEDGRKIQLTENHKVYLKGKKEKRASQVGCGDKLMVSYKKDIGEVDIKEIFLPEIFKGRKDIMLRNVREYLSKFEKINSYKNFYWRDSFPIGVVNKILNRHHKTLYDLPHQTRISIKRDNIALPIRIPLDRALLEVIGLYIAEGHLRKKDSKKGFYQISIACNHDTKNIIEKVFSSHFGLHPSGERIDSVTFSSRIVYELFKDYFRTGDRAKNKRIPSLFLNLKKEKLAALLRGYFEGDGSVSLTDIRITCDSVSEGLKHDLGFVLSRFGIFTKFYEYTNITKISILSNFVKKFKQIGFISERKNKILDKLCQRNPRGMRIDFDENYVYPKVIGIEQVKEETNYCLMVADQHNFFANDVLVHNCDGDEASVVLLMDALLNFSKSYLPQSRGATQDAPLVLSSRLIPAEVDDMVFDLDVAWKYPLEFYEAALHYKMPWQVPIEQFGKRLNGPSQYEGIGFTHPTSSINQGVLCSAYKTLPTMEEKLRGQMELAEKIRAVDERDVARLVIEKHFLRDIKGNLRQFSQQEFRCVQCNEKYRRPPLAGKCIRCSGRIIFTVSEGNINKYLDPALNLAKKYNLSSYLMQTLELTRMRVEDIFGREKEKQEGLGKWFQPVRA